LLWRLPPERQQETCKEVPEMKYAVGLVAIQNLLLSAATIPFQGSVAGTIEILSPGPVIENRATGATTLRPFGVGDYVKHGFMDFGALNPDGSGTGTGTFTIDFGAGNSFAGTYIETAFPPSPAGMVVFSHVYTISGGTGMFAGASGTASHPPALTSLDNLAFSFVLSGVVSAPLLQPVPEPSTLLAGIVAIAFVLLRRVNVRGKLAPGLAHNALGFGTRSLLPVLVVLCCAHAESVELPVAVSDHAGVPPQVMATAKHHYEAVLGRAGIEVRWEQVEAGTRSIRVDGAALVMHIISGEQAKCMRRSSRCLGLALKSPVGRSVGLAIVFYDGVTQQRDASLPLVLGHVMAHETGHLLLGRRHSVDGLMKAEWSSTIRDRVGQGRGGFTPDEARNMRRNLTTEQLQTPHSELLLRPSFCPDTVL
jgi:hypothetical protein